tara:strand:- start:4039 stop:4251 length:213 start_codon:yes stop_codon:yes gene_type:complete
MITKKQLLNGESLSFGNNENEGDMYYNFKLQTFVIIYNGDFLKSSKTFATSLKVLTYIIEEDGLDIFEIY